MDANSLLLGLGNQLGNDLGAGRIIETVSDLHAVEHLEEGISHSSADDDVVGFLHEVADEGYLVGDLGPSQDGKQGTLRVFKHGGKGCEFLFHKESGNFFR